MGNFCPGIFNHENTLFSLPSYLFNLRGQIAQQVSFIADQTDRLTDLKNTKVEEEKDECVYFETGFWKLIKSTDAVRDHPVAHFFRMVISLFKKH